MSLRKNVIDIPVSVVNQTPSEHEGLLGQLKRLENTVVEHYQAGQTLKTKVQQRFGFSPIPRALRSAFDGRSLGTTPWTNPNLLTDFNGQLLSVADSIPRVFAGEGPDSWTEYEHDRVVTRRLSARNLYASNRTIQVPDSAVLNGVRCEVHTETTGGGTPTTQLWVGFKSADGGWVRPPSHFTPTLDSVDARTVGKVVTDGTYFWVFASRLSNAAAPVITVTVFNTFGEALKTINIVRNDTDNDPGIFDVTVATDGNVRYKIDPTSAETLGGGAWLFPRGAFLSTAVTGHVTITNDPNLSGVYTITFVSNPGAVTMTPTTVDPGPVDPGATISVDYPAHTRVILAQWDSDSGVDFSTFAYNAGSNTITESRVNDTHALCSGQLGWLTNPVDNLVYLATVHTGETGHVLGYQCTGNGSTFEYDPAYFLNTPSLLDSLSGYTVEATDPTNQPAVFILIGNLVDAGVTSTLGPVYDPALRWSVVVTADHTGAHDIEKNFQSTIPVTRAFKLDDSWYSWFYYQSGTGLTVNTEGETVTHDPADYFIGQQEQAIPVATNDYTEGAPFTVNSTDGVNVSGSMVGTANVQSGDTVEVVISDGTEGFLVAPFPAGITILKWTLVNLPALTGGIPFTHGLLKGCRLVIAGTSGVTNANDTWDVVGGWKSGTKFVYTLPTAPLTNQQLLPGTFTTAGTLHLDSMTAYRALNTPDLVDHITSDTAGFFTGSPAKVEVSGSSHPGNNIGPTTLERVTLEPIGTDPYALGPATWVMTTTQDTQAPGSFTEIVSPVDPNGRWSFINAHFNATDIGASLTVVNTKRIENSGEFPITAASGTTCDTGTVTAIIAEIFTTPFPTVTLVMPPDVDVMKLHVETVTFDSTYVGATVVIANADNTVNDGTYTISSLIPDDPHGVILRSVTGLNNQINDTLATPADITIYKLRSFIDPFQPVWLMQPLELDTKALAGACESGRAYADWRVEGDSTYGPTLFPCCIGSISSVDGGLEWVLPYRGESVTTNLPVVTPRGQLAGVIPHIADAVGLKTFRIDSASGQAAPTQSTLLLPGTLGAEYTSSGFAENNIVVALEAPFLIAQSTASAGVPALAPNQAYQYIAVAEYTDESGQRTFSLPSPALNVQLAANNNVIEIGGRLPIPFNTDGADIPGVVGTSNRLVALNLYRTCITGSEPNLTPTTIRYKLTSDLNINGLAPVSGANDSGFSFPDTFTWTYLDINPDTVVLGSEELYTDKGFLPRYPVPPFKAIVGSWLNRTWVIGYDNAVWFSGEHTEGDAVWFHPQMRFQLPEEDQLVTLAQMEDYLFIFTDRSVWYLPSSNGLPDAAGNGNIPNAIKTPFTNGCTGWAVTLRAGVAYSSTAGTGQVWLVTRNLTNEWLSQPIQDDLTDEVLGLHVDERQRLHVPTDGGWFVFDQVVATWYEWFLEIPAPKIATIHNGQAHYQSFSDGVFAYTPGQYYDVDSADLKYSVAPDVTFQFFDFGNVRGYKRCWEMQLVGQYKGEHQINIVLSYPDSDQTTTTFEPKTPDPTKPYIISFNPKVQLTSSYALRVFATFTDIDEPGNSFELEMVSAEVGLVSSPGLVKLPNSFRARGQ